MSRNSEDGKKSPWVWLTPLIILAVSFLAAFIAYPFLPAQIPVHWGLGGTQYAAKGFIYLIALLPAVIFVSFRAKYGKR